MKDFWLLIACDQGIVNFYHWLSLRNGIHVRKGSREGPHISVVKGTKPQDLDLWKSLRGKTIEFKYSNIVRTNYVNAWVDVQPDSLNEFRSTLGMVSLRGFHITLGRLNFID